MKQLWGIRRRIFELVNFKGGFISELVYRFVKHDNVLLSKNQIATKIHTELTNWNHSIFVKEGGDYIDKLLKNSEDITIVINDRIFEQKIVMDELIEGVRGFFIKFFLWTASARRCIALVPPLSG